MKIITNIRILLILSLVLLLGSNQNIAQNVGIGAESFTPDPSAGLEVKFSDKGFLPPRMTTEERDEIQNPAEGLHIYNTSVGCPEYYNSGLWYTMCGTCPPPSAPSAGIHVPSETQIVWNWNAVTGADGYKYNSINNYATALDNGTITTYTQIGLDCETEYTLFVWAYNNVCGNSNAHTLIQTTSACPICDVPSLTFTYKGQQVTYSTVESSGKCWLDRNLGATQVATSSTDAASYGDLFQWGRADDGHQTETSGTTTSLSNTDQPAHANFIRNSNSPYDWRSDNNNNRWNANPIVNNPCPSGWRVPTEAEWEAERLSWAPDNNEIGAINSPLKLPLAGYRDRSSGSLGVVGSVGLYWSSSVVGTTSSHLRFNWGDASTTGHDRANGFSVRCIKD